MKTLIALLSRHKGKATVGSVLTVLALLLSRGCDIELKTHVQPVNARTNGVSETTDKK